MDLANPGIMAQFASLPTVNSSVQSALLGQQNIEQNQNVLAQQQRAEEARKAMSDIVLGGGSGGLVATREQQAESDAFAASHPNAPKTVNDGGLNEAWVRLARADPQAAAQLRAQMQQKAALGAYFNNPTPKGTFELLTQFPDLKDEISKGWDVYSGAAKEAKLAATADAYGYLQAGDAPGAIKIVRDHMEADKAAGLDVNGYQDLIDAIQANPTSGKAIAGLMLAAGAGPEKFAEAHGKIGENARSDELQPLAVRKAGAEATTAEVGAQFAPAAAQSALDTAAATRTRWAAQTANEVADLAIKRDGLTLDRDKLTSGIQFELEKLDRSGLQLDAGARQAVNAAVGESASAQALAGRMSDLAAQMATSHASSGWKARIAEAGKGMFGGQDAVSGLRAEYNQLVNAQAVKNLPPGPASDKDIALAKQGFPPDSANTDYLASFLRGMAKMQQAVGASSDRKANWIASNGSLAPVRRDTDVGGVMVPAGTTFNEFNGNAAKRGRQGDVPAGLSSIYQKYGR